jgi:hypothetical protein
MEKCCIPGCCNPLRNFPHVLCLTHWLTLTPHNQKIVSDRIFRDGDRDGAISWAIASLKPSTSTHAEIQAAIK